MSAVSSIKTVLCVAVATMSIGLSGCESNPFKREPVPEPRYIPDLVVGELENLTILPMKTPCDSSMPMLCLVATNAQGQTFQIPYDWIEGFRHAEGVGYVISVRPQIDANKNEMTGHWVLDRVVSQGVRK